MTELSVGEVARAVRLARLLWEGCERPRPMRAPSASDVAIDMNLDRFNRVVTGARSELGIAIQNRWAHNHSEMRKAVDTAWDLLQVVAMMSRGKARLWGPMEYMARGKTLNSLIRRVKPGNRAYVREVVEMQSETIVKMVGADKLRHLLTLRT